MDFDGKIMGGGLGVLSGIRGRRMGGNEIFVGRQTKLERFQEVLADPTGQAGGIMGGWYHGHWKAVKWLSDDSQANRDSQLAV